MTDEQLDRAVRDADPYRPEHARALDGAQTLLEEIMTEPTTVRRRPGRRWGAALAAAAAVTGVLVVSPLVGRGPADDRKAAPPVPSQAGYAPGAIKAAEKYPRLLVGEPGWKVETAYGFTDKSGTIAVAKGGLGLEMNWYPADQHRGYYDDRLEVGKPTPATIDGWRGDLFRYSDTRFAIMLRPRDGVFVELGTGRGDWTRAEFDRVAALVHRVDVSTWLAAMPPEIVTPAKVPEAAAEALAGVPLPPGFDVGSLDDLGVNDRYQFGAEVTSRVGCAWIVEWVRADKAGDRAAVATAADALRGSHQWKVLLEMADDGGWSQVFWQVADQTAADGPPDGYRDAIGCS